MAAPVIAAFLLPIIRRPRARGNIRYQNYCNGIARAGGGLPMRRYISRVVAAWLSTRPAPARHARTYWLLHMYFQSIELYLLAVLPCTCLCIFRLRSMPARQSDQRKQTRQTDGHGDR